ncbi:hypothetical protein AB0D33_34700 [Streptomyces sp. NPDC048404]|uniref:hypothetical protein n=1 Tax=unclassified Streptomyces TaxID=2593676 RepID=UPI0034334B1D
MDEITHAVASGLEEKGWCIRIVEIPPRMARLMATDPVTRAECEIASGDSSPG